MSKRYKGAVISATPPTTSTSSASGVWTEQQFMQGVASGSWPALAGAPTIGTATAGALNASVAFTAPTYTGSGITGYTATSSPGGITGTGASSPVTVSGLTAGTSYTFTVTATTAAGQGPASAASNSVTPTLPTYIEDVYSTYLYTGNGSTQTITNGIDLSTKGGLVWQKTRDGGTTIHVLCDTARGVNDVLQSNDTSGSINNGGTDAVYAYNANGFSTGTVNGTAINLNNRTAVSWTFRKQPKFFDIVTWTGNGTSGRTISHNLGSTPGMVIVKITSGSDSWAVWHTSTSDGYLYLDSTSAKMTAGAANIFGNGSTTVSPTSTAFTVGNNNLVNVNGSTYVAYLFAHNAGGFGLTGTDNVISCGSFTLTGGTDIIDLGYEPQWLLTKRVSAASNWQLTDNMRGMTVSNSAAYLYPNLSNAETSGGFGLVPTATGISITAGSTGSPGDTFIYIAIRRGPMKVPTVGTTVFSPIATTGDPSNVNVGFPTDLYIENRRDGASSKWTLSRLTGGPQYLSTNTTNAEATYAGTKFDLQNFFTGAALIGGASSIVSYMFGRAPSFFDEVCYTGTGSATTQTHNLGVAPELIICKRRNGVRNWPVRYSTAASPGYGMYLDDTGGEQNTVAAWTTTAPTSTVFSIGASTDTNGSGDTYVAYLFATCAGVSKVGSYTGNGTTQTINCGFTTGARFVLLKRTDSTGGWYVYDTARGMTALTDPYSFLNLGAAETATLGSVTTVSTGFALDSAVLAAINASGGTYIFLAIA